MASGLGSITRGTLIYGIGQGVNRLLAFVTLPLFTSFLSPDDFGLIALLALIGFFARAVFGLGIGVSMGIVYFKSEDQSHRASVVCSAGTVLLASCVVLLGLVVVQSERLAGWMLVEPGLTHLVVLQALVVAAQVLGEPLLLRFQYENRPITYVVISVGGAMLGVLAALTLVAFADRGVDGWVEGYLLGATLALAAGLLLTVLQVRDVRPRVDVGLMRELLRLGYPLVPSFFCLFLIQNSGVYFLRMFEELGAAGVYHIGWSIGMAMGIATGAFTTAWLPFFQSYLTQPAAGAPLFLTIRTVYVYVFGLLVLCFFLFAEPVVSVMTSEAFHGAYRVVGIVALAQFLVGFWSALLPGVYFARQVYYVTLVQAAAAAVAIVGNFLFIPWLGAEGTALAMAMGMLAMVGFQLILNAWKRYEVTGLDGRKLAIVSTMIVVVVLAHRVLDETATLPTTMVIVAVLIVVYAVTGWRLGALPADGSFVRVFASSGKGAT